MLFARDTYAQHFPKGFCELNANLGFGSKITQTNLYYGSNLALCHRSRFYFSFGGRLSATHNIREMSFSAPTPNAPVLRFNDQGVWMYSLNFALGATYAVSEHFYIGINSEIVGLSAMSQMTGTITGKSTTTTFENTPTSTNIVVNPSNVGNLQNQLSLNFKLNECLFLNLIFANQRSQVEFLSSHTDYGSFSMTDNAYFFMTGIQWRIDHK